MTRSEEGGGAETQRQCVALLHIYARGYGVDLSPLPKGEGSEGR